jgi:hypothetical protein
MITLLNLCNAPKLLGERVAKTIEVYVTNKEVVTQTCIEGKPLAAGGAVHYCTVKEIAKSEKVVSEEDTTALRMVEKAAVEKNLNVLIIDVTSLKGKIKAKMKGVKTTPTIIFENKRKVGVPRKEELEAMLS